MKVSGELQAEIFKAAMVMTVAGVILYYGKKFVDSASAKLGSIPDTIGEAVTSVGSAVGATGSAALSGIEQAMKNTSQTQADKNAANLAKVYPWPSFDPGTGQGW